VQNLKETNGYRRLTERTPVNYPFNLRDDKLTAPDTYKEDFNYCIILVDPQAQEPVDCRVVKTASTLEKFIKDKHERHKLDILFHPNPVKITAGFWEKYRYSKNGAERLALFNEFEVLTDKNILFIDTITVDVDSPFEQSIKTLNKLTLELDIPAEILEVRRTKSGNLRFYFAIEPINPHKLNRNGKTNLENVKEFINIIIEFFIDAGLKADKSFKRVNHPVWITKPEEVILEATKEINFYTLYRKAKALDKKLKAEKKEKQRRKEKKPNRRLVYLPAFIANKFRHIEHKTALEKAVETLARTHKKGRYIHLLQPVAGWCKYLGLSYGEYYELVYPYARDKQKDIEKAWKYARPLEFKVENKDYKYDLVEYAEKAIEYLKKNGSTARQELLKEIFDNQKWLEQLIMQELKQQGLIKEWFEKNPAGVGRPIKVYSLSKSMSEDDASANTESQDLERNVFANYCKSKFSQTNNLPLQGSILEVVGYRLSLVFCLDFSFNLLNFFLKPGRFSRVLANCFRFILPNRAFWQTFYKLPGLLFSSGDRLKLDLQLSTFLLCVELPFLVCLTYRSFPLAFLDTS